MGCWLQASRAFQAVFPLLGDGTCIPLQRENAERGGQVGKQLLTRVLGLQFLPVGLCRPKCKGNQPWSICLFTCGAWKRLGTLNSGDVPLAAVSSSGSTLLSASPFPSPRSPGAPGNPLSPLLFQGSLDEGLSFAVAPVYKEDLFQEIPRGVD